MKKVLITGTSSGLGAALLKEATSRNFNCIAIDRQKLPAHNAIKRIIWDISINKDIQLPAIDVAILNAGILGEIKLLSQTSEQELLKVIQTNVCAQMNILNKLLASGIKQVIAISSGAALQGKHGWGAYAVSKAAFKSLIEVYAQENPNIHFLNFAPGLVKTRMQDDIRRGVDPLAFPNFSRLHKAYDENSMLSAGQVAKRVFDQLDFFKKQESGSYLDLRNLDQLN